jgi:hypothetical protein
MAKLSRAAEKMLAGIAEFEVTAQCLPQHCVDYRVYPLLMRKGLVGHNLREGVCFTPRGRELWKARKAN